MNTSTYTDSSICLYVILLAFKVFRPIKRKYNLSVNLLLCLVGLYVYSNVVKQDFCRSAIIRFVTYYNDKVINRYIDIFLSRGLVIESIKHGSRQYYKLTNQALSIVNEIPAEYNRVLYEFCNKYSIEL